MKKKIFSFLIVLCLLVGLLPMHTLADAPQVYVRLEWGVDKTVNWILNPGDSKYATTDDAGNVTVLDAASDDYNVKLVYPDDGSTPTLYLKNANIKATPAGDTWHYNKNVFTFGGNLPQAEDDESDPVNISDFAFQVVVEGESRLETTNGSPIYAVNNKGVTVTGAKLSLISGRLQYCFRSETDITFKDADLDMRTEHPTNLGYRPAIWARSKNITIDNTKLHIFANNGACIVTSSTYDLVEGDKADITIQNGSDVHLESPNFPKFTVGCKGTFLIKDSDVEIKSKSIAFIPSPTVEGGGALAGKSPLELKVYRKGSNNHAYFICGPEIIEPTKATTPPTTAPAATEATTPATTAPATQPTSTTGTNPTSATSANITTTPATGPATAPTTQAATTPVADDNVEEKNNNTLIIVGIVALFLIGAALAVVMVIRNKNTDESEDEAETESEEEAAAEDSEE